MNILWIPHNVWNEGRSQRDQYFIRHLSVKHKIHILTWDNFLPHTIGNLLNPVTYKKNLRFYSYKFEKYIMHHISRFPCLPLFYFINQKLLDSVIKKINKIYKIDVIIDGNLGEFTPIPSRIINIPVILDYVDWPGWTSKSEREYLTKADAVIAVSSVLHKRAEKLNKNCFLISNGVDIEYIRRGSGEEIRKKYGLLNRKVVSLIGLTFSPKLYFIDSILIAKKTMPELKCLLVGKSEVIENLLKGNPYLKKTFIYAGPVSYSKIPGYFKSSDIGIYPVEETFYYDAASPIKVFEYTAAKKPVVLPRIKEMKRVGFPNFVFSKPDKESYADAIIAAIKQPCFSPPDLYVYDWKELTGKLEKVIFRTIERFKYGCIN